MRSGSGGQLGTALLAGSARQPAGGGYVNMMREDDGRDRVRAAYRGNYDRLVEVKQRYDPTNLFHINHNIAPF
jgi:FAD/FMN-containing dehydrogenase